MGGSRRRKAMMQGEAIYVELPNYTFRLRSDNRSCPCTHAQYPCNCSVALCSSGANVLRYY